MTLSKSDYSAENDGDKPTPADASEDALIENFESENEAENLWLTVAILYKRYGENCFGLLSTYFYSR